MLKYLNDFINKLLCMFIGHKKMKTKILQIEWRPNNGEVEAIEICERCHVVYYKKYTCIKPKTSSILNSILS